MGLRVTPEANDTFDDHTPIEVLKEGEGTDTKSDVDTFDNPKPAETEVKKEEGGKEKQPLKDSQINQMEDKKEEDKKEEDKKDEKQEAKTEDKVEEKTEEDKKEGEEDKKLAPNLGKKIRLKDGDEATDISLDATVPVKIKGKKEFVSIKDLRDSYSGKIAYDGQFAELKKRSDEVEYTAQRAKEEKDEVMGHLTKIAGMLDDPKGDPLAPLLYLVDISGRNVHDYTKQVFGHLSETVRELDEMDDTERQLYWRDKELSYLKSNQATKDDLAQRDRTREERIATTNHLRQAHGVSEDQYVEAHESLERLGVSKEDITPEAVVDYSVMSPYYDKATGICGEFDADLTTDQMDKLVDTVAQTLRSYPDLDDATAIETSAKLLGWDIESDDSDLDELKDKDKMRQEADNPSHKYAKNQAEGHVESFEDYDNVTYGQYQGTQ